MNSARPNLGARERELIATLRRWNRPLVVGLSGGPDSVALAACVAESDVPARAVHVQHNLRPSSARDEDAARRAAEDLGLTFEVHALDGDQLRAAPEGWEAAARAARYAVFARVAVPNDATVVTAHTAGDRLENVVLRLAEGTGVAGLAGPRARIVIDGAEVRRPMLSWWRDDVLACIARRGLCPVEDPTNADLDRRRAFIRHRVSPTLRTLASSRTLARSLDQLQADAELMEWLLDERLDALLCTSADMGSVSLDRTGLVALPSALRTALLHRLCVRASIGRPSRAYLANLGERLGRPGPFELDGERIHARATADRLTLCGVTAGRGSERVHGEGVGMQRTSPPSHPTQREPGSTDPPLCIRPKALGCPGPGRPSCEGAPERGDPK